MKDIRNNTGKGIKVVVLDTGNNNTNDRGFRGGITLRENSNSDVEILEGAEDSLGHGTGVTYIIGRELPDAEIYTIKVIEHEYASNSTILIAALWHIYNNIECNIINISIGVTCCDNIKEMEEICKLLVKKGIIIVAAFDNGGAISYPAAFDSVIGVDADQGIDNKYIYRTFKNSVLNYSGFGREQRVSWINKHTQIVSGASFTAPYFTAYIAKIIEDYNGNINVDEIIKRLDEGAYEQIILQKENVQKIGFKIQNAVAFPYNKEIHALSNFQELSIIDKISFYDTSYSGNVGLKVSGIDGSENKEAYLIKDISKIDWKENFDTVILGHTQELSKVLKKDIAKEIILRCIEYKKNIYSLSDISTYLNGNEDINIIFPKIDNYQGIYLNKMHVIGKPILGVVGTSSRQGKYTLQLKLRKRLKERGYKVGQLGTEPTGLLFGFDAVYPMGYESTVNVKGIDAVRMVNRLMGEIEKSQPDIILFGSQSQTIPKQIGGEQEYPIGQHELILGAQADAYILCINVDDEIDYIKRTISYLEVILFSKVIALVISPMETSARWSVLSHRKQEIEKSKLKKVRDKIRNELNIKTYILNENVEIDKLVNNIEDFFS